MLQSLMHVTVLRNWKINKCLNCLLKYKYIYIYIYILNMLNLIYSKNNELLNIKMYIQCFIFWSIFIQFWQVN